MFATMENTTADTDTARLSVSVSFGVRAMNSAASAISATSRFAPRSFPDSGTLKTRSVQLVCGTPMGTRVSAPGIDFAEGGNAVISLRFDMVQVAYRETPRRSHKGVSEFP